MKNPTADHNLPIRVICATREKRERFLTHTSSGKSIKSLINVSKVEVKLFSENTEGLSSLYNSCIDECLDNPTILVFMHDDLILTDFFWAERIREGLSKFQLVGLAGNTHRVPFQPSWAFKNINFEWDDFKFLSGVIGHGKTPFPAQISFYGPPLQDCKLLDGLLLAAKSETLINHRLRFDEQFKFHFYDLDFCRTAEQLNLKMGTIPLSLIHESSGNFGNANWHDSYKSYIKKWGS